MTYTMFRKPEALISAPLTKLSIMSTKKKIKNVWH